MNRISCAGFTLIEMIVALAISLCIFAQMLFIGYRINSQCAVRCKQAGANMSISNALAIIQNETRNAKSILLASDSKNLMLDFGTYTLRFEFLSGKIKRIKNAAAQYLTGDGEMLSLTFAYPEPAVVIVTAKGKNSEAFTVEAFSRNQL